MSKRDEYIAKMKDQLDELNQTITEVEARTGELKKGARSAYEKQLASMRELEASAVAKLKEFRAAGEDRWEHLAAESERIHKAFIHSYHYFKSQL